MSGVIVKPLKWTKQAPPAYDNERGGWWAAGHGGWYHVERDGLRAALDWYGEQARLAKLIHAEGDEGRRNLAADGGNRASAALSPKPEGE